MLPSQPEQEFHPQCPHPHNAAAESSTPTNSARPATPSARSPKPLGVSHATIHADLKLFETDWSDIAEQTADDFLFEHVTLLRRRVHRLLQEDPTKPLEAFSFVTDGGRVTPLVERTAPAQIARLHEVHHRAIATAST